MIKTEQDLIDIIAKGQSGIYDKNASLVRSFSGNIRSVIELKNPLSGGILVYQIDKYLQIINPAFRGEIDWFNEAKRGLKLWINDIVISNRILGIKDDNTYDTTVFKKAIKYKYLLAEIPKDDAVMKITFKEMVELVELGARQFNQL